MITTVVLVSGGIDSSTLLYKMYVEGYDCWPLTIIYGQKHKKEVDAAIEVCRSISEVMYDRWKVVDIGEVSELLSSSLTNIDENVPVGEYTPESQASTVVPNRNLILLSIAAGYAASIVKGYEYNEAIVAYAAHRNDYTVYPDCRPEFVIAANCAIMKGTDNVVSVAAPFVDLSKIDIIRVGKKLNVPYELTYSCYNGGIEHCGICGTCHERKLAFEHAGVCDPTDYEV